MQFVDSSDGVRIAVYEEGNPDGPTVVLVHGWPDSHVLWDGVAPLLADRFRIVRYDNRGVGQSSVPKSASEYRMSCFADDFAAVIDAVTPGEQVHVLAHDWGSAGMWEYLARPDARDHIASFTSVSGPSADHMNRFVIGSLKRPYRPRRFMQALGQMGRLSYMAAFSVPVLAPLAVRKVVADYVTRLLKVRDGIPADQVHHSETYKTDAANSLKVYRANYFRSIVSARTDHFVDVPVQVIVNTKDRFIRPHVYADTHKWVPRLWRRDIHAGHWSPMSHPSDDRAVRARVRRLPRGQAREPVAAARAGRPSARIFRRHTGFRYRSGQRNRPCDRARVRPRGCRTGDQRHRRGRRQGHRRRRSPRAVASRTRTPSTSPTPRPSNGSPIRSAPNTAYPTSSSTTPASGRPGSSSTRPARSTTGCSTSTSAGLSTAADHLGAGSSIGERVGTSSTCRRWPHTRHSR